MTPATAQPTGSYLPFKLFSRKDYKSDTHFGMQSLGVHMEANYKKQQFNSGPVIRHRQLCR